MKKPIFTGACTALITPLKNGRIDYYSLDRLIEFQIENGISAIVIAGTTGESSVLTYREHRDLIRHAVKRIDGRVPMIAGTGSNDTQKAAKMTKYACEYGADAVLAVTPYYNKTNQKGLAAHYEMLSDASDKPIIVYNVPGRTCVNILPETYKKISALKNICGIKEAGKDMSDAALTASLCSDIPIYSGNDDLLVPMLSVGASGIISVMSNIFPAVSTAICNMYASGKVSNALSLYREYLPFARMIFSDVNPIPIKYIMSYIGMCTDEMRLPLVEADDNLKKRLRDEYDKLTLSR